MSQLFTRRTILAATAALCAPNVTLAAPQRFALDAARSQVGFTVMLGNDPITGTMPVASADLTLDFARVANSRVAVTLNAAGTRMSVPFATQALQGSDLLDTARFPTITFASSQISAGPSGSQAVVAGQVTIRGVTRPVTMNAQLSQDAATVSDSNPELSLVLTGAVNRNDFGASGYATLVGPTVQLRIVARIRRSS